MRGKNHAPGDTSTLDSFAYGTGYVPYEAQPVPRLLRLPLALQSIARRCQTTRWRAWATETRLWFIEAAMRRTTSSSEVSVAMLFYSRDGVPVAAGVWLRDATHRWWLRRVLEPEEFPGYRLDASLPATRARPKRTSYRRAHRAQAVMGSGRRQQ